MICTICVDAADRLAPADQHCTSPYCTCQHRTDRYQPGPRATPHADTTTET